MQGTQRYTDVSTIITIMIGEHYAIIKWGNSLVICFLSAVVEVFEFKEVNNIEIQVAQANMFEISKNPVAHELLTQLRRFRGRLPLILVLTGLKPISVDNFF
jgi:antitoxin MazE